MEQNYVTVTLCILPGALPRHVQNPGAANWFKKVDV